MTPHRFRATQRSITQGLHFLFTEHREIRNYFPSQLKIHSTKNSWKLSCISQMTMTSHTEINSLFNCQTRRRFWGTVGTIPSPLSFEIWQFSFLRHRLFSLDDDMTPMTTTPESRLSVDENTHTHTLSPARGQRRGRTTNSAPRRWLQYQLHGDYNEDMFLLLLSRCRDWCGC